ncbi:MAG: EAL domain-containing protein [Caldilineaceae bacterium]|nr:EAL domain-containing protein [Caldilineaceae bacterium]
MDDKVSIHLLLIEDDTVDALSLYDLLEKADPSGVKVSHVQRFADGLDLVHQEHFDVVLLDLSLPDTQGLDTLDQLCRFVPELPVVVLTGVDSQTTAAEALRQGAQDFLVKGSIDGQLIIRSLRYAIERHRAQGALRESQERYELAARAANDGLWDWNLHTNRIYYSPRWALMLGYSEEEIGDSPTEWFLRLHPDDVEPTRRAIAQHFKRETDHFEQEYRIRHRSGSYRWMLSRGMALYTDNGEPYRMAGSQSDITARKQTEEKLIHDALHDPLTRLPNRIFFQQQLEGTLNRFRADPTQQFAVIFLDLDRFKTINDSLGHLMGDRLLTSIAGRLERCIPPSGIIARFGGDEFAVLLPQITAVAEATRVAKHMLQAMEAPFLLHGHEIFTSGSIGIALSADNYTRTEEILRDADTAMYRAKAAGMGKYRLFDATMHIRAMALWQLETDLRRAIERDEFLIYYQPIISFKTGQLAGFEALVRWNHPDRGLLYPADFLALAEETGLLNIIDRWTIRHGAAQLREWQMEYLRQPPIFLNVNLSGSILNQSDLPDYIDAVLRETGIHPNTLRLEITEGAILREIAGINHKLAELQKLNVRLCIDDFGTGYSSLSSLHYYPINTLKIDGSFIANMNSEIGNIGIVRTIISLAHDLNLDVIAEGVETPNQMQQLQALACEFGQGVLFAQAADPSSSRQLLQQNPSWLSTAC